ncbi:MAG: FG-GAP repeat protein [Phycisphaerales bacterium]|nr:FG-GAP repeat protein [Phycisphaerales bacterium]
MGRTKLAALSAMPVYLAMLATGTAQNAPVIEPRVVVADATGESSDHFGAAIAAEQSTLLVGAPGFDVEGALHCGKATVFLSTWIEHEQAISEEFVIWTMLPPGDDVPTSANFGDAVALGTEIYLVGSPRWNSSDGETNTCGQVFLYSAATENDPPVLVRQVEQSDPEISDKFGTTIEVCWNAISNAATTFAVGAPGDKVPGENSSYDAGAVHVYQYFHETDTLMFVQRIQPVDIEAGDAFGTSIAMWNDFMAIGAPGEDDDQGAIRLFEWNGLDSWQEIRRIPASEVSCVSGLGRALDLWGANLVMGGDDFAAFMYPKELFDLPFDYFHTLEPDPTRTVSDWGRSVSIDHAHKVLVGGDGEAALFHDVSVAMGHSLAATLEYGTDLLDDMGASVCVLGPQAWVSAPNGNAGSTNSGEVARFRVNWDNFDCIQDKSDNGWVSWVELAAMLDDWGCSPADSVDAADFNDDWAVNMLDLIDLLRHWGSCP